MSDQGFTRVIPRSDGATDDIVAQIEAMIDRRVQALYPRLATVSRVNAGTGMIAIQFHDDDYEGQQTKARTAGVAYDVGDTVLCQPLSPTEWVVTQKFISNNQDRRAVSDQEIRNNAIRTQHVQDASITPDKLSQNYTPAAQFTNTVTNLNTAIANRASTAYVDQQVATRQPAGNYPTSGEVNQAINAKVDSVASSTVKLKHEHWTTQIDLTESLGLQSALLLLKAFAVCAYNNRNNTGNPCSAHRSRLNGIY